jgi:hypothetical protein
LKRQKWVLVHRVFCFPLRALGIKQQLLKPTYPDVAMTLHNLAMLYTRQGDHNNRARALFTRAVGIFESSLGLEHPKTVRCRTESDALPHIDTPQI